MTPQPLVVALGGNALLRRGETADAETQQRNLAQAMPALADLAREGPLVVTHGNGPQVGQLALQTMPGDRRPDPLDVLGAETEGMIGYLLARELRNALPGREVATVLTQVVVDAADVAFAHPTKPIGPVYAEPEAERLRRTLGWSIGRDGAAWRRVVASPEPRRVVELASIRVLVDAGVVVVCAGGGGIPVAHGADGVLRGVEAVVDKDLASAQLAAGLDARGLLLLTDVAGVVDGWGTEHARLVPRASPAQLRARALPAGSMGPKAEAAARFAEQTRQPAAIGGLADAAHLLDGAAGTLVAV